MSAYVVGSVDEMTVSGALHIGMRWVVRPENDCAEPPRQLLSAGVRVALPALSPQPGVRDNKHLNIKHYNLYKDNKGIPLRVDEYSRVSFEGAPLRRLCLTTPQRATAAEPRSTRAWRSCPRGSRSKARCCRLSWRS